MWEIPFVSLHHAEELFDPVPTKIIYCYEEYQQEFSELPSCIELVDGILNNLYELVRGRDNSFIVMDDLMFNCSNDQYVADLLTQGSHHRGISALFHAKHVSTW